MNVAICENNHSIKYHIDHSKSKMKNKLIFREK